MISPTRQRRIGITIRLSLFIAATLALALSVFLLPSRVSTQATQACVLSPSGIIAWWPLDETSGTSAQDIVGANPGIHINGPVPAAGKIDGSLRFNGVDDYVGIGDSDEWAFGARNFTIELWANFNSPGGGSIGHPSHIFIGNDEGPGTQNKWFFALGGGFLNFHINGPVVGSHFFPLAPFSPTLNQWYHLAVTRNGNVWTIYVNGEVVGSEVRDVEVPNANAPLTIGQAEQLGFMNGLLDEVTVYNRALTQGELEAIFNTGKCKSLSISTKALAAVQLGTFSSQALEARFGSPPFRWSVVNGSLPSGMELTADGVLSGIPVESGSFAVTVRVTDGLNAISERAFSLDILLTPPTGDIRIHNTGTLAVPGRTIDYFILVENSGNAMLRSVGVVEFLNPSDFFSLLSTEPPAAVSDPAGIFWEISALAPSESKVLNYRVRLSSSVQIGSDVIGKTCASVPHEKLDCESCSKIEPACQLADQVCKDPLFPTCQILRTQCLFYCPNCAEKSQSVRAGASLIENCSSHTQTARGAVDPNEKDAVATRFIQPDQLLVYPIHFENIGDIEARDVFVTDHLDPNLDLSTINLLTPTGGSFDTAARTVRWNLLNTNLQPGETGNVLLSVRPRAGLHSGTVIRNSATIQFEVFQPLVTNEVVNIIDSTRPASAMSPLPAETTTLDFPISWSGSDAVGEIDFYSILVSVDGGPFTPFIERTRDTSAAFHGEVDRTYGFLAVATDTAGNIEVKPAIAEASTRIVANCASGGDIEPPTISVQSVTPASLWPPDHTMRNVTLNYSASDNCGTVNCAITRISSNEPLNGTGDGDKAPDWEVVDNSHVRLRAERAGNGHGRTYTITITCTDRAGNSTSKNVQVFVPHDSSSPTSGIALIGITANFILNFWNQLLFFV